MFPEEYTQKMKSLLNKNGEFDQDYIRFVLNRAFCLRGLKKGDNWFDKDGKNKELYGLCSFCNTPGD